ncbi:MAG: zinc-ribbon domain-containing protein [Nannocystales bacterium]
MSESRFTLDPSEHPCTHCGTLLNDEVRFCFECGAPVVPEFNLPSAPAGALEELRTAAFSPVSIRPIEDDEGLQPGEPIEIESLGFEVIVDEVAIDMADEPDEPKADGDVRGASEDRLEAADAGSATDAPTIEDPSGTVVAMAPEHPLPFWPAPPKGDTVIAPPPKGPLPSDQDGLIPSRPRDTMRPCRPGPSTSSSPSGASGPMSA